MKDRTPPNLMIEEMNRERLKDSYEAVIESRKELFEAGFIPRTDFSFEDVEMWLKETDETWENGTAYYFQVIDVSINQLVGNVFLNHVQRLYKMANLGYWTRTSRLGEGIATESAKLAARYAFEKLGFQRLEIVVMKDNLPSLRIAEKAGAAREGLLRNRLQLHGSTYDAYLYSLIPLDFGMNQTT